MQLRGRMMEIFREQTSRIHHLSTRTTFIILIILDVICIGMGMGIPVFNIFFGFLVGWYLSSRLSSNKLEIEDILQQLLKGAIIISCATFIGMVLIWGWSISLLGGSDTEIKNFGIPMILFMPRASLIGWLILMIIITPFLQLLTTVFAGILMLLSPFRGKIIENDLQ